MGVGVRRRGSVHEGKKCCSEGGTMGNKRARGEGVARREGGARGLRRSEWRGVSEERGPRRVRKRRSTGGRG